MENTAKVLKNSKSRAQDANIKIAVENHAGDMQGRELRQLIETAGKDFVGRCAGFGQPRVDDGRSAVTLEAVAPYVVTSHVRDSALWRVPERRGGDVDSHGRGQYRY